MYTPAPPSELLIIFDKTNSYWGLSYANFKKRKINKETSIVEQNLGFPI